MSGHCPTLPVTDQGSEDLRERVEPEAIVRVHLFLQRLNGFRHGSRPKHIGRRHHVAHIVGLRVRPAEIDGQAVHLARLVDDALGKVDDGLPLVGGLILGVVEGDEIDKECVMAIATGEAAPG